MSRYIVQHRRGTTTQWAAKDTIIPMEGEIVIEIDDQNSLHKLKIGDGIHTYAELAYLMAGDEIVTQVLAEAKPRIVSVTLSEIWNQDADGKYSQVITLDNITKQSRLDLQPNADMLAEFKQLDLVFVTENKGGVITVYSVGDMPSKSYTMQATVVETDVLIDSEKIVGIPVGTPTAKADWAQTDETQADYIRNKPDIVGQKTPEGGEIFTDYDTNKAIAQYGIAFGSQNVSGFYGYKMIGWTGAGTGSETPTQAVRVITVRDADLLDEQKAINTMAVNDYVCIDCTYHIYDDIYVTALNTNADGNTEITCKGKFFISTSTGTDEILPYPIYDENGKPTDEYDWDTETVNWISDRTKSNKVGEVSSYSKATMSAGIKNIARGKGSIALGRDNGSYGDYSLTVGRQNRAGFGSFAGGRNNWAMGEYSIAYGWANEPRHYASVALGQNLLTGRDNQTVVGRFNTKTSGDLFVVGNGSSKNSRSNAFSVDKDGNAVIAGLVKIGADKKELATKEYVQESISNVSFHIDSELSSTSENAIQNKTVNEAIINIKDTYATKDYVTTSSLIVGGKQPYSLFLNKATSNFISDKTNYAVVAGANCRVEDNSIASFIAGGQRNEVKGQNTFASGYKNTIYGTASSVFGDSNIVGHVTVDSNHMAVSFDSPALYSTAFGFHNEAKNSHQFVLGKYNNNQTNTLFEIGNGNSTSNRSNAFSVDTSGHAILGANPTEEMHAATKGYVDGIVTFGNDEPNDSTAGLVYIQSGVALWVNNNGAWEKGL